MMRTIPYEKVVEIYRRLIRESGGVYGVRDEGLLRASLESAFQTFDGIELYPKVVDKIAAVCYNIIKNHPLIDGNKRLGITLMAVLCDISGYYIRMFKQRAGRVRSCNCRRKIQ